MSMIDKRGVTNSTGVREGVKAGIPKAIFAETSGFAYGIGRGDLTRNRHAFSVNG
jgi:hypothetical protein